MAHIEGTDLASVLSQEGRLEPERALAAIAELADALDAARWGRGLVHGNLGPAQVLVAEERVLLTGFGERRELPSGASLAEAARHFDTGGYPAPEQIQGRPVSPRTDVYALGCLFYECLAGSPPFSAPSPEALLRAHLHEQPPSVRSSGLPAGIDRVIAKAMAKWPEERYSTCTELAAAAQAAIAGRAQPGQARSGVASPARPAHTAPAEPPPFEVEESEVGAPDGSAARLGTRRRKAIAAIGLAALLALVAGAIWLMNDARSTSAEPSTGPGPAAGAQTLDEVAVEAGSAPATPPVERGSLVRLDAATGEIVATIPLDGTPLSVAADERRVWVVDDSGTLSRIDPLTNEVTATFDAPESAGDFLDLEAAGEDVLLTRWLGDEGFEVLHLAAGSDAFERFDLPTDIVWFPIVAGGSLWVSVGSPPGPTEVLRVDAGTGSVLARLEGLWGSLIAAGDFVWVADLEKQEFIRVDTETNELSQPSKEHFYPAGEGRPAAAFGDGIVWALNHETAFGLDPATGEQLYELSVAGDWLFGAGGGAVWTATGETLYRHDIHHQEDRVGVAVEVASTNPALNTVLAGDAVWVGVAALAREDGDTAGTVSSEPPEAELPSEPAGDGSAEPVLSRVPGSLVRIDAKTGEILARLAIPSPKLLASDGHSVWVLSDDEPGDRLIRIDAATNAVTDSFDAGESAAGVEPPPEGFPPNRLAVAGGSAWLSVDWGPIYRFTPGANAGEVAQFENLGLDRFAWPVAAAGSLWVRVGEGGGSLRRVDPVGGRRLADLAPLDHVVAAGPGFVWALDDPWGPNPGLVRIDTETNAVAPLGDAPGWPWLDYSFAVADGALWASGAQPGTIVRLDPVTGEVEGEIDVVPSQSPGPIAGGGGAVWAANRNDGTVVRYDVETGRVQRIVVGGTPSDLVFARGSVWVSVPGQLNNDGSPAEDLGVLGTDRLTLTVDRVPFSFSLQAGDSWERFGSTSINKWISGGQDAEAIIFWNTLPSAENTDRCAPLVGASLADLAAAMASAPGTELVAGPSDVTVGGRAAKHVVVRVREDVGCDPGFFFTWPAVDNAAMWLDTVPGDTIRVWIVDVDGTPFVIEAETRSEVGSDLDEEIQQFVDSVRFEGA
jgi:hypothetical protein